MTAPPERIGRFEIRSFLGQGGMGTLYLAWDPQLERNVAIKVLSQDDDRTRERFLREARSAARLRHPHIITIFDVGSHQEQPFIAMEFIPGFTLADVIREQRGVALPQRIRWMEELCDGLGYAHAAGIVHRDIKPANLMIDGAGALQVLDFGVARLAHSSDLTQAGTLLGTLNYMSPEQLSGGEIDHRSDVHAVGAVLYELLTYRQAFPGTLADGVLGDILAGTPPPLGSLLPGLDPAMIDIVERALRKEPGERYQELAEMKRDLGRVRSRTASAGGIGVDSPMLGLPEGDHPGPPPSHVARPASEAPPPAPSPSGEPPAAASGVAEGMPASGEAGADPVAAGSPSATMLGTPAPPAGGMGTPTSSGGPPATPSHATPAPSEDEPTGGSEPRRSGRLGWIIAVAAVLVAAPAGFLLLQRDGGAAGASIEVEPAGAESGSMANQPPPAVEDSTADHGEASIPSEEPAEQGDADERTEPRTEPPDSVTPTAAPAPLPERCGQLIEKASLEPLTPEEEQFLRQRCGRSGGTP